jgi:hypothetical protein
MRALEGRAESVAGTFNLQGVANTLWADATMGRVPEAGLMWELEGRSEALAGTFNAQGVANTLWAYAKMGRGPEEGMMRELEGRAEAVAGTFKAQEVANSLWSVCVFAILRAVKGESRLIHTMSHRLVSLGDTACFNTTELSQLHQYFLGFFVVQHGAEVWCGGDQGNAVFERGMSFGI